MLTASKRHRWFLLAVVWAGYRKNGLSDNVVSRLDKHLVFVNDAPCGTVTIFRSLSPNALISSERVASDTGNETSRFFKFLSNTSSILPPFSKSSGKCLHNRSITIPPVGTDSLGIC
jgi:hypothetical protein